MARGASSRSGPPPDPNALRRQRDEGGWVQLPSSGRDGEVPEWPLASSTNRERDLWAQLWVKPQAIMWELQGQELEVAIHVRTFRQAESPSAPAALRNLLRQQMEALGLSVPGLLRNRWKIVEAEASKPKSQRREPSSSSARDRLKVVQGGSA